MSCDRNTGAAVCSAALLLFAANLTPAPAQGNLPAELTPLKGDVWQVAPGVVQFRLQLAAPPRLTGTSLGRATYIWFVDTDCNARTGQAHGLIGSEFNVRVVLPLQPPHGGSFIDGAPSSAGYPVFVDGDTIHLRVPLSELGNPPRFNYSCGAFAENAGGKDLPDPKVFDTADFKPGVNRPIRVVIEPPLPLCNGRTSARLAVRVGEANGRPADVAGGRIRFFSSSPLVQIQDNEVRAQAGQAGVAQLCAMIDEVMSCNAAQVMVGSIEVVPVLLHLNLTTRSSGRVSLRVADAAGTTLPLQGHRVELKTDRGDQVIQLDSQGNIQAKRSGAGQHEIVRGTFDGMPATNWSVVRVLDYPVPLLPEREEVGQSVSFWYPPLTLNPIPACCRFETMLRQYNVVATIDRIYARMADLTGGLPFCGGRQHLAAVCEDSAYKICGGNGNPVGLGFNPQRATGCLQLTSGEPHWGVMLHEMGHNFTMNNRSVHDILFTDSPRLKTGSTFREGLATLCNLAVRAEIAARPGHFGVPPTAVAEFLNPDVYDSLPFDRRVFVTDSLGKYLASGARYPEGFDPNVLDGVFIVLAEKHGWGIYRRFFSIFWPPDELLRFRVGTEERRATFFIAALSAAAKADLRPELRQFGLPCDDILYTRLLPTITWRAGQRD